MVRLQAPPGTQNSRTIASHTPRESFQSQISNIAEDRCRVPKVVYDTGSWSAVNCSSDEYGVGSEDDVGDMADAVEDNANLKDTVKKQPQLILKSGGSKSEEEKADRLEHRQIKMGLKRRD